MALRVENAKLLEASKWHSVEEVPDFPFGSFLLLQEAIGAGRCHLSIDRGLAFRHAELVQGLSDYAFNLFLSWVPFLACIASAVMAFVWRDYWLFLGIPFALVALFTTTSPNPIGLILRSASALPLPFGLFARLFKVVSTPPLSTMLLLALFFVLLFNNHGTGAWLVGTYILSSQSLNWLNGRSVIAVSMAAAESESFFLYLLSHGDVAIIDKGTGNFLSPSHLRGYTQ